MRNGASRQLSSWSTACPPFRKRMTCGSRSRSMKSALSAGQQGLSVSVIVCNTAIFEHPSFARTSMPLIWPHFQTASQIGRVWVRKLTEASCRSPLLARSRRRCRHAACRFILTERTWNGACRGQRPHRRFQDRAGEGLGSGGGCRADMTGRRIVRPTARPCRSLTRDMPAFRQ